MTCNSGLCLDDSYFAFLSQTLPILSVFYRYFEAVKLQESNLDN